MRIGGLDPAASPRVTRHISLAGPAHLPGRAGTSPWQGRHISLAGPAHLPGRAGTSPRRGRHISLAGPARCEAGDDGLPYRRLGVPRPRQARPRRVRRGDGPMVPPGTAQDRPDPAGGGLRCPVGRTGGTADRRRAERPQPAAGADGTVRDAGDDAGRRGGEQSQGRHLDLHGADRRRGARLQPGAPAGGSEHRRRGPRVRRPEPGQGLHLRVLHHRRGPVRRRRPGHHRRRHRRRRAGRPQGDDAAGPGRNGLDHPQRRDPDGRQRGQGLGAGRRRRARPQRSRPGPGHRADHRGGRTAGRRPRLGRRPAGEAGGAGRGVTRRPGHDGTGGGQDGAHEPGAAGTPASAPVSATVCSGRGS